MLVEPTHVDLVVGIRCEKSCKVVADARLPQARKRLVKVAADEAADRRGALRLVNEAQPLATQLCLVRGAPAASATAAAAAAVRIALRERRRHALT